MPKCEICGKELANPNSQGHINSKFHQEAIATHDDEVASDNEVADEVYETADSKPEPDKAPFKQDTSEQDKTPIEKIDETVNQDWKKPVKDIKKEERGNKESFFSKLKKKLFRK